MAITYEASGSTSITPASSSWSFTPDGGTLAGDVFVVQVFTQDANANITPPAGSTTTAVNNHDGGYAPGGNRVSVFAWVAPSNAPGAQTVGVSAAAEGTVTWARFRGVDTSSPFDAFQYASNGGGSAVSGFSTPAVTTTVAGCYVLAGLCIDAGSSAATLSGPSGSWTNLFPTISPRKGAMALKGVQPSTGSSGAVAGWGSSAGGTADAPRVGWQAALRPGAGGPATPELAYAIIGAATSDGFTVHAKVSNTDTARLKVASNSGLTSNVAYSDSVAPDADGFVALTVTGLPPRSRDHYAVELTGPEGVITTPPLGSPRRVPEAGVSASFSFAFGSCWNPAITGTPAFTRMLAQDPTMFFHLGDWNYTNSESTSQASHRADMEAQIVADSGLRSLIASVPTTYVKSDHDGDANEQGPGPWTAPNRAATLQMFPYPDRPNSDGLYHSFVIGRARFICIDTRYLGNNSTTLLGATQLAWLKAEFEQPEPLKFFVMDGPWITDEPAGNPATDDDWATYSDERDEIAAHWVEHGVGTLIGIHGDQHAISADDGTNNPWGGFPTVCAAPFRNTSSIKTTSNSKWSQGIYPTTEGVNVAQYGVVDVDDSGDRLVVTFRGYDETDAVRVSLAVGVIGWEPPEPIAGTSTAGLTTPADRWVKSPVCPLWQRPDGTWRAILPTSSGHRLYSFAADSSPTQGAVVDSRQAARVGAVHHEGTTWVLRQHSSSTLLSSFDDSWSAILTDVSVPLTPANNDASPVALLRTSNGHLWAACHYGDQVRATRSTDGGATWATPTTWSLTGTGVVILAEADGNLVIVATANDGVGRSARRIAVTAGSISSGLWVVESLPSLPSGITSDDHAAGLALPDGRVLVVSKTTGSTSDTQPLIYGLIRSTSGTWTQHTIEPGPDTDPRWTRPSLTRVGNRVYLAFGSIEGDRTLWLRETSVDSLGTWSARVALAPGPDFSDSAVLPREAAVSSPWPYLAHKRDAETIVLGWVQPHTAEGIPGHLGSAQIVGAHVGSSPVVAIYVGDLQLTS